MTLLRPDFDLSNPFFMFWDARDVYGLLGGLRVPSPVIAGGYVRDTLLGQQWKDIDVFIPGELPAEDASEDELRYDVANAKVVKFQDREVNLISLRHAVDVEGVLSRMDIGLCQVAVLPDEQVVCTQAFLDDMKHRTITVLQEPRTDGDFDHIRRVQTRFADYALVPYRP